MGQTQQEKQQLIETSGEERYNIKYLSELPRHRVCVDGFWIGKYEVTNAQYRAWKPTHDSTDYEGRSLNGGNQPVVYVNWEDANGFTEWLTRQHDDNVIFSLPTEAQWEYSARAGATTSRFWGDKSSDACDYANVHDVTSKKVNQFGWTSHSCDDGYAVTAPVGNFRQNEFGLYDMLGNVGEWMMDTWHETYDGAPADGSAWTHDETLHILRGGSWSSGRPDVRNAIRGRYESGGYLEGVGFRLVRMP